MLDIQPPIHRPPPSRTDTVLSHYRAVERVISAMHQRLDQDFSLAEMANVAYMSPYHFNRVFRQLTGVPPCQFMSALRLESARRLLLTSKLSVTEVCFEVGYSSLGTFTRRFTDLMGHSPRSLRRLARSPMNPRPVQSLVSPEPVLGHDPPRTSISGRIAAPADFAGVIFIGLFVAPIPQGRPVGCAVLDMPGPFRVAPAPDGSYYLFAAGFREETGLYPYETALRAGGQRIRRHNGRTQGSTDLKLRPALPTDPPILMTFPASKICTIEDAAASPSCVHELITPLKMASKDKKRLTQAR